MPVDAWVPDEIQSAAFQLETRKAAVNVLAGQALRIDPDTGLWAVSSNAAANTAAVHGIAISSGAAGDDVHVVRAGVVSVASLSAVAAGNVIALGASGALLVWDIDSPPVVVDLWATIIGVTVATGVLRVSPAMPGAAVASATPGSTVSGLADVATAVGPPTLFAMANGIPQADVTQGTPLTRTAAGLRGAVSDSRALADCVGVAGNTTASFCRLLTNGTVLDYSAGSVTVVAGRPYVVSAGSGAISDLESLSGSQYLTLVGVGMPDDRVLVNIVPSGVLADAAT